MLLSLLKCVESLKTIRIWQHVTLAALLPAIKWWVIFPALHLLSVWIAHILFRSTSVYITFSFWCVSFWDEHTTDVAVAQVIGASKWPHHVQRALYYLSEEKGMTHRDLSSTLEVMIQFILTKAISQRQWFNWTLVQHLQNVNSHAPEMPRALCSAGQTASQTQICQRFLISLSHLGHEVTLCLVRVGEGVGCSCYCK